MQIILGRELRNAPAGTLYQEVLPSGLLGEARVVRARDGVGVFYTPLLPMLVPASFDPSGMTTVHHPAEAELDQRSDFAERQFMVWQDEDHTRLIRILAAPNVLERFEGPLEFHMERIDDRHWVEAVLA